MSEQTTPRVYVGTYAKYNAGSIAGAWIDLTDAETFSEEIRALHSDEVDPEYMYQDFEGFPEAFYSESHLDPRVWEYIEAEDYDREAWAAYLTVDSSAELQDATDRNLGEWDSVREYAEDYIESTGMLANVDETVARYFDYDSFARDLAYDLTVVEINGGVRLFDSY